MNDMQIRLSGTMKEQARQLLDILKERELSVEQLDKIVPLGTDFIKELSGVLKEQIVAEKESHKISVEAMQVVMTKLADSIKDNQLTREERQDILEAINKLGEKLRDIQIDKQRNDSWFKAFLGACLTVVVVVICFLAGKKHHRISRCKKNYHVRVRRNYTLGE